MRLSAVSLSGRVDRSHLTMESFTKELVSNASEQLFPDNTVSLFSEFIPEQVNLESQREVAISELSYPSTYRNVTEGKFLFFVKKNFKVVRILFSGTRFLPIDYGYC